MNYLLGTDILSLMRRIERQSPLVSWLRQRQQHELFLSAITIGEIERGIAKQRVVDVTFANILNDWFEQLLENYAAQILPITVPIARRWGKLSQALNHNNADLLIAATALEHGLTVVTHNIKHFTLTGVSCFDPLAENGAARPHPTELLRLL